MAEKTYANGQPEAEAVICAATPVAVHDVYFPPHVGLGERVVVDHVRP